MKPILVVAALLFACVASPLSAEHCQVWVPGHWQAVEHEQIWVSGGYHARPVTTTTTVTTVTVHAPPPPPPQVWVAERWLWTGSAWQLQPGHWETAGAATTVVAACPPPPPPQQVVHVHHYERQPRVTFGVGVLLGSQYGHGGHHGGHHVNHHSGGGHHFSPPPPLPGSHFLPRPPRNLLDPLGLFRHDPLGIIRRK